MSPGLDEDLDPTPLGVPLDLALPRGVIVMLSSSFSELSPWLLLLVFTSTGERYIPFTRESIPDISEVLSSRIEFWKARLCGSMW